MSVFAIQVEYQLGGGSREPSLTRLTAAFERAGVEVADVAKHVFPKLVGVLEAGVAKQFATGGSGPEMGPWAPLSPSYAAWKAKHYPGAPLLVRKGALRAALTDSGAPGARRDISDDSLAFGTSGIPYASAHQSGSVAGHLTAGNLPARPVFDFGPDFERAMGAAVMAGVREAVRSGSDGLLDFDGDTFEGLPVQTGASGGRFVESGGVRTYLKKTKSGQVVKRTYRGRKTR